MWFLAAILMPKDYASLIACFSKLCLKLKKTEPKKWIFFNQYKIKKVTFTGRFS